MKDPKHPHQPTRPVRQSGPLMRALEPRIMFDAAVAATVTDNVHADSQAEASPPAEPPASDRHELLAAAAAVAEAQNPRQEIVFVDTSVADYQSLVNGINTGAEVVLVHAGQGGLQVIADTLQGRSDIDAIHILSHGDTGKIWLGNDWIDSSTITTHQALLSTIGSALSENGDILLYGCRVAEDGPGFNFIRLLADATGADIAASNDLTGSTASGGDWILESQVGQIDANTLTFAAYHSLLAVPLDENYDDNPGVIFNNQNSFELDGVRYTINGSGIYTTLTHNMNDPSLGLSLGDNASDYFLLFDNNGIGGITSVRIEVSDGSYFKLSGLSFNAIADSNITITPYDGVTAGTGVSYARTGDFITREYINLPEDFQNISSFTIAGENLVLTLDDLDFEPPVIPNTAPIINNLNGDSVNWSGVNNWVTLDAANNATVTDAELDVANWDDATLTIQRAVSGVNTPLAADLFRFNESGFTVNGNNLQSGATTFGTFTNVNGVLSIEFNANADATLVQSVMRGIQYRNDTPTGDTVIRFALSDGDGGSATADVTVTSDTIYVTSATDTTVIDVSDGVSFREAVAIAAADLTGSQTIVFSSALAGLTLDINGPTNINESLIFDMDATGSITLSGGPIALGMGTTQTFINGAGDTATITNSILGAGAITKMGAGNLTLSGLNSFSGATTISEGTLTVSGADAISANSNVSVAAGATLALTSNATIGNLSGAGDIDLGSRVLTTTQTADTVFSGNISGTGGLTITQHINAGYSLTLSGTNSYSGNTTTNYGWVRLNGDASVSANSALRIHDSSKVTLLSDQTVGSLAMNTTSATLDLGVGGYTLTAGGNNTSTNVLGVISGSGNLWKQGTGTMTVTGINNTYNGNTVVTGGTLSIASDAGLGSGTVILGSPDATLAITGNTAIDNAIAITDTATISVSADATISGIISGDNLRKAGTAKLTLSGNNTYTGTTSVGAGILSIGASTALGDGNILLAAGTTLDVTGVTDITNDIVLSGNATISNSANVTVSGDISGNFNLTKSGNLTLTLSGDNTYLNTTVSAGTLSVASDTDLGNGTVSLANGSTLSITGNTTIDNAITLTGNATINAAACHPVRRY